MVCESFSCTPEEAERQSWRRVKGILDYRLARQAVDAFDDLKGGMEILGKHPELMEITRAMVRAQTGADEAEVEEALGTIRQRAVMEQQDEAADDDQ